MYLEQNQIYIFLGPTLSIAEAKVFLPKANYLPPIQCGDILHILNLNPKIIAIIDGRFEVSAAVWHKEILLAIQKGILVFGASSMGALRAAELTEYGMIGIGKIFKDFYNGKLNDDDEVAIIHAPYSDFKANSESMVNIRATLKSACKKKILTCKQADTIIAIAKKMFYKKRSIDNALKVAKFSVDCDTIDRLNRWLKDGYVDLKKNDAQALLEVLSKVNYELFYNYQLLNIKNINETIFLREIYRNTICSPSKGLKQFQLEIEKKSCVIMHSAKSNNLTKNLAFILSAATVLVKNNEKLSHPQLDTISFFKELTNLKKFISFTSEETRIFISELNQIQTLIINAKDSNKDFNEKVNSRLISLIKIKGDYLSYKKNVDQYARSKQYKKLHLIASLWILFEYELNKFHLTPTEPALKKFSEKFRNKKKLFTVKLLKEWLLKNDLDLFAYWELMNFYTRYSLVIYEGNFQIFGLLSVEKTLNWYKYLSAILDEPDDHNLVEI